MSSSKGLPSPKGAEQSRNTTRNTNKKQSRSVLPQLRTQLNGSEKSTFGGQKKTSVTPSNRDDTMSQTTRNKTPASGPPRKPPRQDFMSNFGMMTSEATQRSKELYSTNFILDIDNQTYSTRQNRHHLGSFYKRIINSRILQGPQHTPNLNAEQQAIAASMSKVQTKQQRKATLGQLTLRHNANMSRTIGDINPNQDGDIDHYHTILPEASGMAGDSALDKYTTARMPFDVEKQTLLPSIAHLQSDDSLFGESKTNEGNSKLVKYNHQISNGTNNRLNATELTAPQTSKNTQGATMMQLTVAESILHDSNILDPLAGSSIISHLNKSLHYDAKMKIGSVVMETARKRSQQRRRIELAGEEAIVIEQGRFKHEGSLEGEDSESMMGRTQTESIADSAIYNELANDMDDFIANYEREKKRSEEVAKKKEKITVAERMVRKDESSLLEKQQYDDEQLRLLRQDPQAHFKKLKAQIKLTSVKKFQEDINRKKQEAQKAAEPVTVMRDRWGRIMEKKNPKMSTQKLPSKSRRPIKKEPPKLRLSFTECQMKYYGAKDVYNPLHNQKGPTLTDQYIIEFMKAVDRYPIAEALMRPQPERPYNMVIDSIIKDVFNQDTVEKWGEYKPAIGNPYNSMESDEDFNVYESDDSEDPNAVPYITKKAVDLDPTLTEKQFDMRILATSAFRLESMKFFPYRTREGEMPTKLLAIPKMHYIFECLPKIEAQQKEGPFSAELIQNIFEYYCVEMKAAPIVLANFYNYEDPKNTKLSFRNFQLDQETVKALACVLPYIHDINELDLNNNQITDMTASAIAFAFFMNPSLRRITVAYNYIRQTFCRAMAKLIAMKPEKLTDINLMGSIIFPDHLDPIIRELTKMNNLQTLNIAGCTLTHASCRQLSLFVFKCFSLRHMDVSHCRINFQGSRYLIDALNRNTCIRNFNFSHNDLNSQSNEFAIKVASIISRHPCLMHLDISNTNLKKEEIMFIGLAVPTSKTLLSIHLTSPKLPYYERIFLRAVINARVAYQYKNVAMKKEIRTNMEKNQILQMASGEVQEDGMLKYVDNLRDLDEKREGLDLEIQELLAEVDTEATYEKLDPEKATAADLGDESKIGQLVGKLYARQKELEEQQVELMRIYDLERGNVSRHVQALKGGDLEQIGMEAFQDFGIPSQQQSAKRSEDELDMYAKMRELKVERHKQRAEMEIIKENKDRSAGELALMFMGINQVAYDLLLENPMVGYMNEIILSRVLGQEEIEEGAFWTDTTQCWVCHKWNKVTLAYHLVNDKEIFQQKVTKVDKLQYTISRCLEDKFNAERLQDEIEVVENAEEVGATTEDSFGSDDDHLAASHVKTKPRNKKSKSRSPPPHVARRNKDRLNKTGMQGANTHAKQQSNKNVMSKVFKKQHTTIQNEDVLDQGSNAGTESRDKKVIDEANLGLDSRSSRVPTDAQNPTVWKPHETDYDTTDALVPIKATESMLKKFILPERFEEPTPISYHMPNQEEMYGPEMRKLNQLELQYQDVKDKFYGEQEGRNRVTVMPMKPDGSKDGRITEKALNIQRHYMGSKGGSSFGEDVLQAHTSVISYTETKRRTKGEPVIIQRQIFFEGVVYQIEEELYSDSDHSSVISSDDDFEVDKNLQKRFKQINPLKSEQNFGLTPTSNNLKNLGNKTSPFDTGRVTPIEEEILTPTTPILGKKKTLVKDKKKDSASAPVSKDEDKSPINAKRRDSTIKKQVTIKEEAKVSSTALIRQETSKKSSEQSQKAAGPAPPEAGTKIMKSMSKTKQAMMREYFTNDPNLTEAQQKYEPKPGPKFYKPKLAEKRLKTFSDNFSHPAFKLDAPPERNPESMVVSPKTVATVKSSETGAGFKPASKEIFCVASFNDWTPCRMKTLRTLTLERHQMDTEEADIPKTIKTLNNQVALYGSMVAPGVHYFYFVRDQGTIFLSPNYEVIRFKSTNIFLNRIEVTRRLDDFEQVHIANDGEVEEAIFMKDRSVFRDYREDSQNFLKKAFESDWAFGKIPRIVKKGAEFENECNRIKELIFEHYVRIINIFEYYSGTSSYPTFGFNDQTSFVKKTLILDGEHTNFAAVDLIITATAVSHHTFVKSAVLDLTRYEFIEMIARVAEHKFLKTKMCKTMTQGIEKVLEEHVYPYTKTMNGEDFRRYQCYSVKVNEILKKNEAQLKKVYESFTELNAKWVRLEQLQVFVRKVGLKISDIMIGAIFAESMMTIIDPIKDPTVTNKMKYVEFLVFLCRITFEEYKDGPYDKELLYLKLDHLMPAYLAYSGLQPMFLFSEKFSREEEEEKLLVKRKKQKLRRMMTKGSDIDLKLVAEVKAYDESLMKAGMGSFKASQMGGQIHEDSDSDLGISSDEGGQNNNDKFERDFNPSLDIIRDTPMDASLANDLIQNADLAADVGNEGPIGVVITPPHDGDKGATSSMLKGRPEVVFEEEDEDLLSDVEVNGNP